MYFVPGIKIISFVQACMSMTVKAKKGHFTQTNEK